MNKEFVDYKTALALKELGFDEPFVYYVDKDNNSYIYNFQTHPDEFIEGCGVNVIPTPTFSQAFRWFREKHDLHGCIDLHVSNQSHWYFRIDKISINGIYLYHSEDEELDFNTYEEAELECLKKLIEIVDGKLKLV